MKYYMSTPNYEIEAMFNRHGYTRARNIVETDIVVYPGGPDVSPELYSQEMEPRTKVDRFCDLHDLSSFFQSQLQNKINVGICRGAQLLHVCSGGSLVQHIPAHTKKHPIIIQENLYDKEIIQVTSTHHQMMFYNPRHESVVHATADELGIGLVELEVVWHNKTKSLCYQPHPEYVKDDDDCCKYFFNLIKYYTEEEK